MNILLLGSGGREHALALKLSQSTQCSQLFIAPGNAGTAQCGKNVSIGVSDFQLLKTFCLDNAINLVVPGSEEALVNGIYDFFKQDALLMHIPVIGPSQEGARLEGSKAYAKLFMQRHNIPTAAYREFSARNYEEGVAYLQQHALPIVLKADGLAAGKGVVIATSQDDALKEFEQMIKAAKFGDASKTVVVEEFLTGIELSVFAITDGQYYKILPVAKDYKRISEGDEGLNTGGMGAISPVPFADETFMKKVEDRIIRPTISGLFKEKIGYQGFVFFGLINVAGEPFVIEYNCRMGDPETEVVMPRLKNDLVELFVAITEDKLEDQVIYVDERAAATVMLVSKGYPEAYEKNKVITGIPAPSRDQIVFHAGTRQSEKEVLTNGGRVLAITSLATDLSIAVAHAVQTADKIAFEGKTYRRDIGYEFI